MMPPNPTPTDQPEMRERAREVLAQAVEAVTHDARGDIIRNVPDGELSWMQAACIRAMLTFATTMAAEARLEVINTPETVDFMAGVPLEAAHQRERWGSAHDTGKTPEDWFWLIGYLAQKALRAQNAGDLAKAQHHTISTAAALANWHAALTGADTAMRPGIEPPTAIRSSTGGGMGRG